MEVCYKEREGKLFSQILVDKESMIRFVFIKK